MRYLKARNRYVQRTNAIQEAHDDIMKSMSAQHEHNMDSIINLNRW